MQEILSALGPLTISNIGGIMVLIWGPGLAVAAVVLYRFYQERKVMPRELLVLVAGVFVAMSCLPLMSVWQSFEALSIENWAKLTAVELAIVFVILGVASQAFKGQKSQTAHHFVAEWNRRRHIWAIGLPLIGLLLTFLSTRSFVSYVMSDTGTATVISQKYSPGGHQLLISAEWEAPEGKKIPVEMTFDKRHAFLPKIEPGVQLPFRLNAQEAAAGKVEALYTTDIGVVATLLSYLSTVIVGLAAIWAGIIMRSDKKA